MTYETGRVTILPEQFCRLAELAAQSPGAIEVIQKGSVLYFNNGDTKLSVNADGNDIEPPNQEKLC